MEVEFEQGVMNTYQMNLLLKQYEQTLYANYSHEALSPEEYLLFEKQSQEDLLGEVERMP